MENETELWTIAQAASYLGLKPKTVYNGGGGTGKLLRVSVGRGVRLLAEEVRTHRDRLIEEAHRRREKIGS